MKRTLWVVLALSGCVTTTTSKDAVAADAPRDGRDRAAASQVRSALEALPRCEPGANVGALVVRATICTKMHCREACCNQCSWAGTLETKSGQREPVDAARVKAALRVTESALDCEIAAWAQALAGQSLSLDAPVCVVR